MKKLRTTAPPELITLIYREVGRTHVFTAEEFRGFHIGASNLRTAYEAALSSLGEHVGLVCGCETVHYDSMTYDQFHEQLIGRDDDSRDDVPVLMRRNTVVATRASSETTVFA